MSWDIYGNHLRAGYCEVHPDYHEPFPCYLCLGDGPQQQEQPPACQGCSEITGNMMYHDGTCDGIAAENAEQMRADWVAAHSAGLS